MGEQLLCSSRAAVLLYDEVQRQWQPVGGSPPGPSCVQLLLHPQTRSLRLLGRRLQPEPQVVLDCALGRGLRYSQTTPQFHQWRQGRRVWGLSFAAPPEAARFAGAVLRALRALDTGEGPGGVRWGPGGVPGGPQTPQPTPGSPPAPPPHRIAAALARPRRF
uniref:WH1 domain-containing protein n=1 Tax=Taeniopygia guttata TaxID=59729 RepID=A0A674GB66_TAEGU